MGGLVVERVRSVNTRLRALIFRSCESLAGRGQFNAEDVSAIAEPIALMQPFIDDAKNLRAVHPGLDGELETYKGILEEMQIALEQMRVMLIARRTHIEAARGHLAMLGMWNAAVRLTR